MALTKIITDGITDDAVTEAKLANAINTAVAANTAKDLTALSAANLTSGTIPDARFPATLPAASAANLTAVPAANITGTLPAISATNLTNVPAANITGTLPAISGANLTNLPASGKAHNLVVNGSMQVAQRGTSSTADSYATVDRWAVWNTTVDEAPTQSQSTLNSTDTGPWQAGFRKALRITNGNQTSGASAASRIFTAYVVEAQDMAKSGWNYTSSSSYITLSFWVRASVAGNYYGYLYSFDGTNQAYSFDTGSLTANTWTKVTKTVPGNSNLTFDNDNAAGLYIAIAPYWGTNYTSSGNTMNQWAAWNGANRTPDNPTGWYTANDATWDITGVQLEVGSVATDFEHRSYSDELMRCKRYFNMIHGQGSYQFLTDAFWWSDNELDFGYTFPVEMRATPSVYQVTGTGYIKVKGGGADDNINGGFTLQYASNRSTSQYCAPSSGGNNGKGAHITVHNTNFRYGYSAEL